jgi:outer membrane protein OmpA-like peptidoglycan-associated protein
MKKLFFLFASALLVANVCAQNNESATYTKADGTQSVSKYPSVKGFVSNGFWDNWELSFGAGVSALSTTDMFFKGTPGGFGDYIGFEANVAGVKWFHPVFGGRLQLSGGRFSNLTYVDGSSTERTPYLFGHADFLINFSNWAGGYRADRAYYAVPFVGFGLLATDFTDRAHELGYSTTKEFAFTFGLLNKFRIAKSWDFEVELKSILFKERAVSAEIRDMNPSGKYANSYSATLGFAHRFNTRDWNREAPQKYSDADIAGYAAAIAALEGSLADARNNEKNLADQLAAANKALADAANKKSDAFVNGAAPVFFKINSANLSERNNILLDLVADEMNNNKAQSYTIAGYADKQTGSEAYNQKLSEQRAQAVADYLINKGVAADRLDVKGYGASEQPFSGNIENNRVVVIK